MRRNIILLLHSDQSIVRQFSDLFKPYGITLKTRPSKNYQPWSDIGASTACVVLEVNSKVYTNLISRVDIKTFFGDVPLFLLATGNVYQAARRDFSSRAIVMPANRDPEEIVETVLRIVSLGRNTLSNSPEISFRDGEKRLTLPLFLDFAREEQLTGTLRLHNANADGAINLWRGEMQHIRAGKLRGSRALQNLMEETHLEISFFPKIYRLEDVETYSISSSSHYSPNCRDVMVDFFAICHRCWCNCKPHTAVAEIVLESIKSLTENARLDYHLIYLPAKADVLQILGTFYPANIAQIYELVARIHQQLFTNTVPDREAMAKMASELQELKPFLESFSPFRQLFDKEMKIIEMPGKQVVI